MGDNQDLKDEIKDLLTKDRKELEKELKEKTTDIHK